MEKEEKSIVSSLRESAFELKKLRSLTVCAMLAAAAVALSYTTSIQITPTLKIGFSAIPNQLVDWLFGPVTGALFAAVLDVLKFMLKPDGPFFPGYTFTAALAAFIYGLSYYKRPVSIVRVFITKAIVVVFCNVFLNTLWGSILYGDAFFEIIGPRFIANIIKYPVDAVIFYLLAKAIEATGVINKYIRK